MTQAVSNNRVSAERLMRSAARKAGLNDFGDQWFVPHLDALLTALADEPELSAEGREMLHARFEESLVTRLRLRQKLVENPEILDESIEAPVIIIGLPRTGTTKLQRMMAAGGDFAYLPLWQALQPISDDIVATGEEDPRAKAGRDYVEMLREKAPELLAVHEMGAEEPEEEIMLMQHSFLTKVVHNEVNIPAFLEHVDKADCAPVYRELRDWLKYLQWQNGGERKRWLLKCVFHNEFLEDLLEVFPDACLVQLHRDTASVIGSWTSLVEVFRKVYADQPDLSKLGKDMLGYWQAIMDTNLEIRRKRPDIDVKDFLFSEVIADIDQVIADIYAYAGIPLTEDARARMAEWEKEHAQHKHGRHQYSLEQYGLTRAEIEKAFAHYREIYQV